MLLRLIYLLLSRIAWGMQEIDESWPETVYLVLISLYSSGSLPGFLYSYACLAPNFHERESPAALHFWKRQGCQFRRAVHARRRSISLSCAS